MWPFSVLSIGWRITTVYGLAYGLESAVVNFFRFPQLGITIGRRVPLDSAAAYCYGPLAVAIVQDHTVS